LPKRATGLHHWKREIALNILIRRRRTCQAGRGSLKDRTIKKTIPPRRNREIGIGEKKKNPHDERETGRIAFSPHTRGKGCIYHLSDRRKGKSEREF